MSFKIQINSVAAIERLIGGDTEFEIELRESAVQEFTKRYLKGIVATEEMDKYVTSIKNTVQKEAESAFGTYDSYKKTFTLRAEAVEQIKKVTTMSIDTLVRKVINEEYNRIMEAYQNDLEIAVQQRINVKFNEIVDAEVEKRWNALKAKM